MIQVILLSLVTLACGLFIGNFHHHEWPAPNYPIDWLNECNQKVSIYGVDYDWDPLVAILSPGESFGMNSSLGQQFFASLSDFQRIGKFTVHWDENKEPALGSGWSRHFILQCPNNKEECLATDQACQVSSSETNREPPRNRIIDPNSIERKRHLHEITRIKQVKFQLDMIKNYRKPFTEKGFLKYPKKMSEVSPLGWAKTIEFYEANKDTKNEVCISSN
jgi:hypothetical protein